MYNIQDNPNSGLDVGKAESPVLDTTIAQNTIKYAQQQAEQRRALQQKKEQARQDDIMKQLSGLKAGAIMPHDSPIIQKQQQDLMDWASQNGEKLWKGDPATTMLFNQKKQEFNQAVDMSVRKASDYTSVVDNVSKNQDKFLPDTYGKLLDFAHSENAGKPFNSLSYMTPMVDFNKMGSDVLTERLKKPVDETKTPIGNGGEHLVAPNVYTAEQATSDVKQRILNDHNAILNAEYKIGRNPDAIKKYGFDVANPESPDSRAAAVNYISEQIGGNIAFKGGKNETTIPKKTDAELGIGGGDKKTKVNGVYTDLGGGKGRYQFEYATPTDNSPIMMAGPNNSPYKGEAINVKPIAVNFDGRNTTMEAGVVLSQKHQTANETAKALGQPEPYPSVINLPYTDVKNVMANKFESDNVFDIQHGTVKPSVKLVNAPVVKSNQAEKRYILNGVAYKQSALEKQGYDVSTLKEHKE